MEYGNERKLRLIKCLNFDFITNCNQDFNEFKPANKEMLSILINTRIYIEKKLKNVQGKVCRNLHTILSGNDSKYYKKKLEKAYTEWTKVFDESDNVVKRVSLN